MQLAVSVVKIPGDPSPIISRAASCLLSETIIDLVLTSASWQISGLIKILILGNGRKDITDKNKLLIGKV